jgi:hypothetical protein
MLQPFAPEPSSFISGSPALKFVEIWLLSLWRNHFQPNTRLFGHGMQVLGV